MTQWFVLLLGGAMGLSLALTYAMRHLSHRLGLVDHPGERKVHRTPTPNGGGVAIFLALWLPVWGLIALAYLMKEPEAAAWPALQPYMAGAAARAGELGIIFLGAVIIWVLGLIDDRWGLSPWFRLIVQVGVALMLFASGFSISLYIDSAWIRGFVTVLWMVGLINSFNMLDNMDGLSAGVALIIASAFFVVCMQTDQTLIAVFLCCFVGAVGGFLFFNFPRASIFMGDSGGTLLGYCLAAMTLVFTFSQQDRPYYPMAVPLIMFGLPLFDTITVVWIRIRSGRSPWKGDTNHFSHRLVALGMTPTQAVLTIYLVTATVALGATALYYAKSSATLVILAQTLAVFVLIGILERARPKRPSE